ncbi:DUF1828 domain-containing protein [Pseudomonas kurunegalensis]|uniref:DUF1828 domain-containing protein n=1 Tax=Pseudomonas kurunegalensis TaxID=485880 RepID=A0ACC5UKJ4_9PSED|nr:DUF1828 domain-containing protein [Pseudomonas kurunegalensis]MBV4514977.1 DUF1828 domain-containing protein [Pseudomonas kurunegalensis]
MSELAEIRKSLCSAFCDDVAVRECGDMITVALPMVARDGDQFTAYLSRIAGGWRISDSGTTMMRLSYENDISKFYAGSRGKLYQSILAESGLSEVDGEIYLEVPADKLIRGLFDITQGLSRVEDMALWSWSRVGSTFYDDLRDAIKSTLPEGSYEEGYIPEIPDGPAYMVDYKIRTQGRPVYLFGVNGKDKARVTTITLLHLKQVGEPFTSIIVCSDFTGLPKQDSVRLLKAANDFVPDITDLETFREKVRHHVG